MRKMIKNTKVIVKDRRDKAKSAIKTKKTNKIEVQGRGKRDQVQEK